MTLAQRAKLIKLGVGYRQQARNMSMVFGDKPDEYKPTHIVRDRGAKFTARFCSILESNGIEFRPIRRGTPL